MSAFEDVIAGDMEFFKANRDRNHRVRFAKRCELEHAFLALSETNKQSHPGSLEEIFIVAVKQIAPGCRYRVLIPFGTRGENCNPEEDILDDAGETRARQLFDASYERSTNNAIGKNEKGHGSIKKKWEI